MGVRMLPLRGALLPLLVALATAESFVTPPPSSHLTRPLARATKPLPARFQTRRALAAAPALSAPIEGGSGQEQATPLLAMKGGKAGEMWGKAKVWVLIALWYIFNVQFNIYNKRALNCFNMPWAISVAQLGVGSVYSLALWLLRIRKVPQVDRPDTEKLTFLSVLHAVSHVTAITSLGAGAVSFTHIVKSMEPFFASLFAGLLFGQFFHPMVYLSLIPVVGGVAYASLKELDFSWLSFNCAMTSNVVCAVRGVVVKGMMGKGKSQSKDLSTSNLYSILTIAAALMLVPPCIAIEGKQLSAAWQAAIAHPSLTGGQAELIKLIVMSGLTFFLYNEVAFVALESLHPISHAVVNTIKRVVIIVVSVLVFRNPLTTQSIVGSTVAIAGVFLYSLAKYYFK